MKVESIEAGVVQGGLVVDLVGRVASLSIDAARPSDERLSNLLLDDDLERDLGEHFARLGYTLETASFLDRYGFGTRQYTAAVAFDVQIALLQVPTEVLTIYSQASVSAFSSMLTNFRAIECRLLSRDVPTLYGGFTIAFADIMGDGRGRFINWNDIELFRGGTLQIPFSQLFHLEPARASTPDAPGRELRASQKDVALISKILASIAANQPRVGVEGYFRSLVVGSDWPDIWKQRLVDSWTGNAEIDAQGLISWTLSIGRYPANHDRRGQTVVGWLLWERIDKTELGFPDDASLAKVILEFDLVTDREVLARCHEYADKLEEVHTHGLADATRRQNALDRTARV